MANRNQELVPIARVPVGNADLVNDVEDGIPVNGSIRIQIQPNQINRPNRKKINNSNVINHPHHLKWLLTQGYDVDSIPTKKQNIIFDDEFHRQWMNSEFCGKILLIFTYFFEHGRYLSILLFPLSSLVFLLVLYNQAIFSTPSQPSNPENFTLLHLAIIGRLNDAVVVLLEYKANIHTKMKNGNNALLASVSALDINIVKSIIAYNPIYSSISADASTAIGIAVDNNRHDIVRALLEGGANPDQLSKGVAPLETAVRRKLHEVVQVMIDIGHANPNITTSAGETLLMKAVCDGDERIIEYLLRGKANSDFPSRGMMPLVRAILDDNINIVKLILRYPINMSYQDLKGDSYLMIANNEHIRRFKALRQGQHVLFQSLLDLLNDLVPFPIPAVIRPKIDPNLKNNKGRTAMMELVIQEYFGEFLNYIWDKKIDWKTKDNDQQNVADYLLTSKIPSALYIVLIRAVEPQAINIENYDSATKLYPVVGNCQNVNEICSRLWILRQDNVNLNVDSNDGNVWVWLMESFINEECNCDLVHFLKQNKCDTRLITSFKHDNGDNVLMRIISTVKNDGNFTRSIIIFLLQNGIGIRQSNNLHLTALTIKPACHELGKFLKQVLVFAKFDLSNPKSELNPTSLLGYNDSNDHSNYLIFLSHYKKEAKHLCGILKMELMESLRIDATQIFYDEDELDNVANIPFYVQSSACLIFVWSNDVLTRPWCLYEFALAIRHQKEIIPLIFNNSIDPFKAINKFRNDYKANAITINREENRDFFDVLEQNKDNFNDILAIVDREIGKCIHQHINDDRWLNSDGEKSVKAVRSFYYKLLHKIASRLPKYDLDG